VCQLEGSDHGGRDSAAELALADTIDVQASGNSCNWLTLGPAHPTVASYTSPKGTVNAFVQRPSLSKILPVLSMIIVSDFSLQSRYRRVKSCCRSSSFGVALSASAVLITLDMDE
jgi:hypothetical protein